MSLVSLAIYAALAAAFAFGVHTAWSGFTGKYIAEGAATQIAADQKVITGVKARADSAELERDSERERAAKGERETAACVASARTQSAGVKALADQSARLIGLTHAEAEAAKRDALATRKRLAELAAYAAAKPVGNQACESTLGKTDAILREEARARRATPAAPEPARALGLSPK